MEQQQQASGRVSELSLYDVINDPVSFYLILKNWIANSLPKSISSIVISCHVTMENNILYHTLCKRAVEKPQILMSKTH